MRRVWFVLAAVAGLSLCADGAKAAVEFDQNITGNMIFGSGNSNGGFTTFRDAATGIELGLRAKVRYPSASDNAAGIRSHGNGTYGSFDTGAFSGNNASWNIDWSINSNYNGSGGNLNTYTYSLQLDIDPGIGTNFVNAYANDPIRTWADHSFGNNSTPAGGGSEPFFISNSTRNNNNLVQNSLNVRTWGGSSFNPTVDGLYTIRLSAYDNGQHVGTSEILVQVGNAVIPEPASLLAWGGIICCVGLVRRRHLG